MNSIECRWRLNKGAFSIIAAFVLAAGLSACTPTKTDRVRVTVEVTDGKQIFTGSAVQELSCRQADPMLGNMDTGSCSIKGEAVDVDMRSHGHLFMIFAAKNGYYDGPYIGKILGARPSDEAKQWQLPMSSLPMFVAFTNTDEPGSVYEVDPDGSEGGIRIASVRVAYTNDRVTKGVVEKALPWLKKRSTGMYLTGRFGSSSNDLPSKLQTYHFTTLEDSR